MSRSFVLWARFHRKPLAARTWSLLGKTKILRLQWFFKTIKKCRDFTVSTVFSKVIWGNFWKVCSSQTTYVAQSVLKTYSHPEYLASSHFNVWMYVTYILLLHFFVKMAIEKFKKSHKLSVFGRYAHSECLANSNLKAWTCITYLLHVSPLFFCQNGNRKVEKESKTVSFRKVCSPGMSGKFEY